MPILGSCSAQDYQKDTVSSYFTVKLKRTWEVSDSAESGKDPMYYLSVSKKFANTSRTCTFRFQSLDLCRRYIDISL